MRNPPCLQPFHDFVARARCAPGVDNGDERLPPVYARAGFARQSQPVNAGELLTIIARPLRAFFDKRRKLLELDNADRPLQIGHAKIVPEQVEVRQQIRFGAVMALLF